MSCSSGRLLVLKCLKHVELPFGPASREGRRDQNGLCDDGPVKQVIELTRLTEILGVVPTESACLLTH